MQVSLAQINDPDLVSSTGYLFGMKLLYNKVDSDLGNDPLFNGNISSTIWRCIQPTGLPASGVTGIKAYKYSYDNLNRLLESDFYEYNSEAWSKSDIYTERIHNSETGGSYDLNGNIQGIVRQGLRYPNNSAGKIY